MKRHLFPFFPTICVIILVHLGCTAQAKDNDINITISPNATEEVLPGDSTVTLPTSTSLTNTLSLTPPIASPTRVATASVATNTATITTSADIQTVRVCSDLPSKFNYRETLGVNLITYMRFIDENLVTFEGWSNRPEPEIRPVTPEPTPSEPFSPGSSRTLFQAGDLNLATNELTARALDFAALLHNPCGEECPLEILTQAPDSQWQLVQVSDWLSDRIGIWLVGQDVFVRLVDYVPAVSEWQWSADSSLLWYVYSDRDYGAYANIIRLDNPPVVISTGSGSDNPLDPTYYFLAFSPQAKTVISTENPFEQGLPDTDELYIFDFTQSFSESVATMAIPGLVSAVWNEATQDYLLEIVQDGGVEFREVEGALLVQVPRTTLERVFPNLAEGKIELNSLTSGKNYALSPSGKSLAIAYDHGEIWVFDCQEDPSP